MSKGKTAVIDKSDTLKGVKPKTKEAMLLALEHCKGIVTTAAKMANIHRDTHYDWMKADPAYAKAVEEIGGVALDFAEAKLLNLINSGNVTAVIFYLKTKGKNRGYVERVETVKALISVGFED